LWEEYDKLTIEDIGNVVADLKKIIDKNQRINK